METNQTTPEKALADLLAALPQMFPGTQQVPLANIRSNPKNPGPPITEEMVEELAANITEAGLLNAIKLMPDPEGPLADGVALHPENPMLKADGRPWEVSDFKYLNLSGELRYRAFQKLQRTAIPANILNPTPEEAVTITHLDNKVRDRGWWADYQSIENLIQANPNLSVRQVAVKLELDRNKVSRAISLLPLLNPEARALNGTISAIQNKGISEIAASRLTDLAPGMGLKPGAKRKDPAEGTESQKLWPYPAIPPETQDLVRRVLAVAYGGQMTEAQVKRLVEWVRNGNSPESYADSGKSVKVGKVESEGTPPYPPLAKGGIKRHIQNLRSPRRQPPRLGRLLGMTEKNKLNRRQRPPE